MNLDSVLLKTTNQFHRLCIGIAKFVFRFLISSNKLLNAERSLQWLRGEGYDITMEFSDMKKMTMDQTETKFKMADLMKASNIKPFIISVGLMLFQQVHYEQMTYSLVQLSTCVISVEWNQCCNVLFCLNI